MTDSEKYFNKYWNARKTFINYKHRQAGISEISREEFKNRVLSRLDPTGSKDLSDFSRDEIKKAARATTSTRLYQSQEEMFHRGATDVLKENKLTHKIYQQGGSLSMGNTTFTKNYHVKDIDGVTYTATGTYNFGGVAVIFYMPTDSKDPFRVSIGGKIY